MYSTLSEKQKYKSDTFWGCILSLGAHMRNSSLSSACNMICSYYLITFPEIILSFSTISLNKIIQSMENLREKEFVWALVHIQEMKVRVQPATCSDHILPCFSFNFLLKNVGRSSKKIEREGEKEVVWALVHIQVLKVQVQPTTCSNTLHLFYDFPLILHYTHLKMTEMLNKWKECGEKKVIWALTCMEEMQVQVCNML